VATSPDPEDTDLSLNVRRLCCTTPPRQSFP
jgi:hypothetical protein